MIILRLFGGLGNQLFIYAFGRAAEMMFGFDVHYDCYSGFIKDKYKRKFELDNFYVQIKRANLYESLFYPINKRLKSIRNIFYPGSILIEENDSFTVNKLENLSKNFRIIYLQGYFQKAEYFESIKKELKKEIVLNRPFSEKAKLFYDKIKNNNSVAVHIRLKERATINKWLFFTNNISRLKKELNNPVFFIFSDDIKLCKKNLIPDSNIIFIENNDNHIEDFCLMKYCNHFIISNSTFSWWASWLSDSKDKIILINNF